ncbi:MAG: type I restriction-modification system subunit M N-terminal domain-containing protein [Actinomycetota bacterium]
MKRLSDAWDEEQEKAVKEFGKDVDEDVAADFHAFAIPKGCHWSDLRREAENHGVFIQGMMQKIEEANPKLWPKYLEMLLGLITTRCRPSACLV